jgi:hypothetical protein
MGYTARIDQLDYDGSMYNYSGISSISGLASYDLNRLRDGDYETPAENIRQPHWVLTPGFGGGLAIRLGYGASLGLEHKVSMPNTDLLDGQRWNRAGLLDDKLDIHHYSSFWVSFRLFGKRAPRTPAVRTRQTVEPYTRVVAPKPSFSVVRTDVTDICEAIIVVQTRHINNISQLRVSLNGTNLNLNEYFYTINEGILTIRRPIFGYSTFTIYGNNSSGQTIETVSLDCAPTVVQKPLPRINIINPVTNITKNCLVNIRAQLFDIDYINQIEVLENQRTLAFTEYTYNSNSGILEINRQLNGDAQYAIKIWNETGVATTTLNYNCSLPVITKIAPPAITLLNPTFTPFETSDCPYAISVKVENVDNINQIKILRNAQAMPTMDWQWDANNNILTWYSSGNLTNTYLVLVENKFGKAQKSLTINCKNDDLPNYDTKITICHYPPGNKNNPQTIDISESAWPAHQSHGDLLGACPVRTTPTPTPVPPIEEPRENKKITICHYPPGNKNNPQTIDISESAWPAHQSHGDLLGACPARTTPTPTPVPPIEEPRENKKITICHYPPGNKNNPQTIDISESAWPAHQLHGDLLGTCPVKIQDKPDDRKITPKDNTPNLKDNKKDDVKPKNNFPEKPEKDKNEKRLR